MSIEVKKTRAEAGRAGGMATLARYGREQLREWGKRGGRPRALTYDEIRQRQRLEQKNNGNKEVIKGSPGSLAKLKMLYKLRRRSSGFEINQAGIVEENPTEAIPAGKGRS